jgi:hypothetical protein
MPNIMKAIVSWLFENVRVLWLRRSGAAHPLNIEFVDIRVKDN